MIEDQLTHDERLRLECLAQAVQSRASSGPGANHPANIVQSAERFERFVRDPEPGPGR